MKAIWYDEEIDPKWEELFELLDKSDAVTKVKHVRDIEGFLAKVKELHQRSERLFYYELDHYC